MCSRYSCNKYLKQICLNYKDYICLIVPICPTSHRRQHELWNEKHRCYWWHWWPLSRVTWDREPACTVAGSWNPKQLNEIQAFLYCDKLKCPLWKRHMLTQVELTKPDTSICFLSLWSSGNSTEVAVKMFEQNKNTYVHLSRFPNVHQSILQHHPHACDWQKCVFEHLIWMNTDKNKQKHFAGHFYFRKLIFSIWPVGGFFHSRHSSVSHTSVITDRMHDPPLSRWVFGTLRH